LSCSHRPTTYFGGQISVTGTVAKRCPFRQGATVSLPLRHCEILKRSTRARIATGRRRRYVYRSPSCDKQRMRIVPAATNAAGVALLLAALIFDPSRTSAQQIAATRAGIAPVAMSAARVTTQHQDSVSGHRGSRKSHVVIGVVVGALAGGVLGGLSARNSKDTGTALDGVATAASVTIGALAGLIVGGVIGAFIPHS
jgi:hypothetical protein